MDEEYVKQVLISGEDPRGFFNVKPLSVITGEPWEVILVEVSGRMRLHTFRQLTSNAPVFLAGAFAPPELRSYISAEISSWLTDFEIDFNFLIVGGDNFFSKNVTGQFPELNGARAVSVQFELDFKEHNADELRKYKLRLRRAAKKQLDDIVAKRPYRLKPNRPDPLLTLRKME